MTDKRVANQIDLEEEDTQKGKFLTFNLGNESYGIDIKYVTEIIGIQPITEVPELPAYIRGIINLRGKIVPVMDVRLRFKKEFYEYNERTCIIVVDLNDDLSLGLIVDKVSEVISIPDENIAPPPDINLTSANRFVKGIGKVENEVKIILDCDRFLLEDDINALDNIK